MIRNSLIKDFEMSAHKKRRRPKSLSASTTEDRNSPSPVAVPQKANLPIHWFILAALFILVVATYAWTIDFPMVFDDCMYLKDNPLLRDPKSFAYPFYFKEFANLPAKLGADPDYAVNFILRPVAYATFRLNYLFDDYIPRWYRVGNILIHAANSMLVFALVSTLLANLARQSRLFIATTAAALFAVHPMAIESVTYIVQRFTSLGAFFSLLSLWLYFLSVNATRRRRWLIAGSVVTMLLAMLTKECSVTGPIMAVLLDWLVLRTNFRSALRRALPLLLCLPLIPVLVMMISAAQNDGLQITKAINIVNSKDFPISNGDYLLTQISVVSAYLQRLFWPAGLNIDPDWPIYRSILDPGVIIPLSILSFVTAALCWLKWRYRQSTLAAAALVFWSWYFITISISSGLVPLPDVMAEHRSYLPSIGIFVMIAIGLDLLRQQLTGRRTLAQAFATLMLGMMGALIWTTTVRNQDWSSCVRLWADTADKSPGKFRVWGNLGASYSEEQREEEAVVCYRKALELEPRFQGARFNLANALFNLKRYPESLETIMVCIQQNKDALKNPQVLYTFALGLATTGKQDQAIACLEESERILPTNANTFRLRGLIHKDKQQFDLALKYLYRAAALAPPDPPLLEQIKQAEAALAQNSPASNR